MRARRTSRRGRQAGIALVLVAWIGALLAVIGASLAVSARQSALAAAHRIDQARADARAEGGVWRAVLGLLQRAPADRWATDGTRRQFVLDGRAVWVSVRPETARIDLNMAPAAVVGGVFTALAEEGLETPEPLESVAAAVLDARDADHERRPGGAEDDDYAALGLEHGARDGPFAAVSELTRVPGMTRVVYERVAPVFTVYTSTPGIDPMTAPRLALLAVPGMDPARADAILAERAALAAEAQGGAGGRPRRLPAHLLAGVESYFSPARGRMFRIVAESPIAGGGTARHEAVVRVRRSVRAPVSVLAWTASVAPPIDDVAGGEEGAAEAQAPAPGDGRS